MSQQNRLLLKEKDYQLQAYKLRLPFIDTVYDPLLNPPKKSPKKSKVSNYANPLFDKPNPLNRTQIKQNIKPSGVAQIVKQNQIDEQQGKKNIGTPWQIILQNFLKVYDIKKQSYDIQVANAFGSHGIKMQEQLVGNASNIKIDKDNNKTISIRTYLKIIQGMKKDIQAKWDKNDKVGTLQIAIQSCKLLHDTSNAKFHALKFAYVLQIVQRFGIYVFERIKCLSFPNLPAQRIQQITIKDLEGANIPQSAQQICRNWLLKISSIRQLIPRTIIETTLLRLHFFLNNGQKAKQVLNRLAKTNRCFGQHINCIFFCTFLIRMGKQVLPQDKDYILDILDDVFFYIKQGKSKFGRQDISYDEFFNILEPFFISSFQSLSQSLQRDKFKRFCNILPQNPHPVILKNFIQSFSPSLLVYYSIDIARMLQKIYKQNKYMIYKIMLQRLRGMIFSQSNEFIVLVWTDISQLSDMQILLDLLGPFSEIVFRNLPRYQKNKFYSLIFDHFNNSFHTFRNIDSKIIQSFKEFLSGMLARTNDLKDILTLQPFLQIVSYFPSQFRQEISINITQTFLMRDQEKINDPVIVHIMLSLMKNIEGVAVDRLAIKFLKKIDFQNDLQQTLNFFAEMRAAFGHIQEITVSLIYKASALTIKARKLSKGKITTKVLSFLQATIAFCYITVPVLQNPHIKLKLYVYLSEIALSNNLISQATSLIKTCITQLAETDAQSDLQIYHIFKKIISFLIVMPDDPQNEFLFLFNGLFQAFLVSRLKSNYQSILKFQFYTQCIIYLSCQAQQRLPFHIQGVISNDGLFKSKQFRKALVEKIHEIVGKLQQVLQEIIKLDSAQVQNYSLKSMVSCLLSLISIFDNTPRLINLLKKSTGYLERISTRVLTKDKIFKNSFSIALNGLNSALMDNQIKLKVKF